MKNNSPDSNLIQEVFREIPREKILEVAQNIQQQIKTDTSLIQMKDKKEFVTKADIQIQKIILEYFQNSKLNGTYFIKAEETLSKQEISENSRNLPNKSWQLLIDPLDGTSAFCRGEETWGTMVGACDLDGNLIVSWNLVSTGEVYDSFFPAKLELKSFPQLRVEEKIIKIDVYDYGAGVSEQFRENFSRKYGYAINQFVQTSYPAAIWAGWELFTGKLNALHWIPSNQGKKWYPDYDLIFLGACQNRGLKTRLGKINNENAMITIAPSDKDLDLLWETGLEMVSPKIALQMKFSRDFRQITNKL